MKILFIGDTQCSVANLDRSQESESHILEVLRKEQCSYLVHLGDLKEVLNPVDQRVTNHLVSFTQRVVKICPMLVQRGNHDQIHAQGDHESNCLPVVAAAGATVFDRPTVFNCGAGVALFASPYYRNPDNQRKAFKQSVVACRTSRYQYTIHTFHNALRGSLPIPEGYELKELGADYFDICIGGHIHEQQEFSKNVWYCGSPFCMDWGEANEQKGFLLLNTTHKTVTPIPSKIPGWFDPNKKHFPAPKNWNGARIRIYVAVTTEPAKELAKARKELTVKYPGAELHLIPQFAASVSPEHIDTRGSSEQILQRYLQHVTLPKDVSEAEAFAFLIRYLPKQNTIGIPNVQLETCTATNVLSFEKVTLALNRTGLTLVTGVNKDWKGRSNGAAKTSLLTLPIVGLFGQTPKLQKHNAWIRNHSTGQAELELRLQVHNKKIVIRRGRRKAFLRVWVNGKECTMGSPDATQDYIEHLTGLTWSVLTNTLYVGQREIGAVFGTEKERKELFSRLLGLEMYLEAQKTINSKSLALQQLISEREAEISSIQFAVDEVCRAIQLATQNLAATPSAVTELRTYQKQEATTAEQLEVLSKQIDQMKERIQAEQQEFQQLTVQSIQHRERKVALQKQLDASDSVNQQCSVCGSIVTAAALSKHKQEIQTQLEAETQQYENFDQLVRNNRWRSSQLESQQRSLLSNQGQAQRVLVDLAQRISTATQQEETYKQWRDLVRQNQQRQFELESVLKIHELAVTGMQDHRAFLDFCSGVAGRNGLPAYLCSVVAPSLNAAATRYSNTFAEGEISVQFSFSNGDIDVHITNLHGGAETRDQSAGEMRMAALISAFASRSVMVPLGVLILDEPGESLDAENARIFAKGLRNIVPEFGTVFLVSHNANIISELEPNYHLEVVKENGISVVVEKTV